MAQELKFLLLCSGNLHAKITVYNNIITNDIITKNFRRFSYLKFQLKEEKIVMVMHNADAINCKSIGIILQIEKEAHRSMLCSDTEQKRINWATKRESSN